MTPRIVFVLRSGGEYMPEHVETLCRQCKKHAPTNTEYHLFTDVAGLFDKTIYHLHPLKHNWPGWWSKMEMFTLVADEEHPTLFMDLDTVVVDDLWPLFNVILDGPEDLVLLRDFYRPQCLGSGLMGWKKDLTEITFLFEGEARKAQHQHARGGDQAWLMEALPRLEMVPFRWQDKLNREVVSYKVHVRGSGRIPPGALICCFHGQPRPWAVTDEWVKQAGAPDVLHV